MGHISDASSRDTSSNGCMIQEQTFGDTSVKNGLTSCHIDDLSNRFFEKTITGSGDIYTVIRFVSTSAKFGICTAVSLNKKFKIKWVHRKKSFPSFPFPAGMSLPNSSWAGIMMS